MEGSMKGKYFLTSGGIEGLTQPARIRFTAVRNHTHYLRPGLCPVFEWA